MTENVNGALRGVCPVLARYLRAIEGARWSCDAARAEMLRPWLPRLEGSRLTPAAEHARAQWLARRALTWWAPLAGMAAVIRLEARGFECGEVRAAYLALLESPTLENAQQVQKATHSLALVTGAYAAAHAFAGAFMAVCAHEATLVTASAGEAAAYCLVCCFACGDIPDAADYDDARDAAVTDRDAVLRMAVEDFGELLAITEAAGESEKVS